MKKYLLIIFVFIASFYAEIIWESADRVKPLLNTNITELPNELFIYSFQLTNEFGAEQVMHMINIKTAYDGIEAYGSTISKDNFFDGWFFESGIIWAGDSKDKFLQAGESSECGYFISNRIPGIIKYEARGWFELPVLEEEPLDEEIPEYYNRPYTGYTIAPDVNPETLTIDVLIRNLDSLLTKTAEVGWLTSSYNGLSAKIKSSEKHYLSGRMTQAKNALENFSSAILKLRGGSLSENGYLVLSLNTDYILSKLQ